MDLIGNAIGYRHAKNGWYQRDESHPPIRPHDSHHQHDVQFEAE